VCLLPSRQVSLLGRKYSDLLFRLYGAIPVWQVNIMKFPIGFVFNDESKKNFEIKVADYKKVISVADINVSGQKHMAGSHFVSFDRAVLPYEKILTWYLPPVNSEDKYETGNDNTVITSGSVIHW